MVDGEWTTDHTAPQEDDGHGNLNNVLLPENIKRSSSHKSEETTAAAGATAAAAFGGAAAMSGVTPNATTAGLAGGVPKESDHTNNTPGAFPETPANETESFGVKPIPASSGIGNPVQLNAGEKVPDPSTINENTVESTATTDKAGYDKDASATSVPDNSKGTPFSEYKKDDSAFSVPEKSANMIPESSLPIGQGKPDTTDSGPTMQSAAPESTTAALAGAVPKEPRQEAKVEDDEAPSATVSGPAEDVPEVVKESLQQAHQSPEAAASGDAVEGKKEMESQLLKEVKPEEGGGEPAPSATAATTETAPAPTSETTGETAGAVTGAATTTAPAAAATEPPAKSELEPPKKPAQERELSPMSKDPDAPVVTTGVGAAKTDTKSTPKKDTTASTPSSADSDATKEKKKKNRASK